ncbi:MAG: OsmC family protein [Verrucomicrobia bacterium]|nr:OsmC family protein [Verrucomicrobiota bacterium]
MIKYPLFFEVRANSPSGIQTLFEGSALDFPPIPCAIPTEFNGPGGGYSPEELLSLAVLSCVMATFKVFAERSKVVFDNISASAKLTIDRNPQGVPELKKLDMKFTLSGVQDQQKARALLVESEKYCLVSNAVKSEKSYEYAFV